MICLALALSLNVWPCPTGSTLTQAMSAKWKAYITHFHAHGFGPHRALSQNSLTPPVLPTATNPSPWGGSDPSLWRAEAILANAVSRALNEGWASAPDVEDVVVSVPVSMLRSDFHPYGDGQSNSSLILGSGWTEPRPPFIATLIKHASGTTTIRFRFDRTLDVGNSPWMMSSSNSAFDLPLTRDAEQDYVAEAVVPSSLGWNSSTQSQALLVRPKGWTGVFPVLFRHPVMKAKDLLAQVSLQNQKLADGRCLMDPEQISAQKNPDWRLPGCEPKTSASDATPFERLMLKSQQNGFGPGYNVAPFEVSNVHGMFPVGSGFQATAVGSGRTWLMTRPGAPFKILYTCFQGRTSPVWPTIDASDKISNLAQEKKLGVPTGGGWHEIGVQDLPPNPPNYAETIINSLEPDPIPLGSGTQHPGPPLGTDLKTEHYAFSLTDVVSVRFLFPGEAQITVTGESSWGYDHGKNPLTQAGFHWFLFPFDREVCTEEWVHPCLPDSTNHIGLVCQP
jgi:hypothetical protein